MAEAAPPFVLGHRVSFSKTITDDDIRQTAVVTGDTNPLHLDDAYAQRTRFRQRIAHGVLTSGVLSAAIGTQLGGPDYTVILLSMSLQFQRPVLPGDTVTATAEVTGTPTSSPEAWMSVVIFAADAIAAGVAPYTYIL
ncbi:MAG: MaoC family dehydratase [Dehalococcoidia bacterium]|nr:MaoC family dehydratase [Dehalococcoidia bacterium]